MHRTLTHPQQAAARIVVAIVIATAMAPESDAQGARPAPAGVLRGRVRDESGRPLAGAGVSLSGTRITGESDEAGAFSLARVAAGDASLVTRRIGYAPETTLVHVGAGGAPVVVTLRRVTLRLDAVIVRGRRELRGPIAGFYTRMELGNGRFFTADQIADRNPTRMSDLLRGIPGFRIDPRRRGAPAFRLRGGSQQPLIWLDGTPMGAGDVDIDNFDPRTFAAIEVYSGSATVPVEFAGTRTMSTSGGAIILWTKQGEYAAKRRRGGPSPAAVLAGLIERRHAFTADSVDTRARPVSPEPIRPIYPDSLFSARIPGRVEVEFVVDAKGRVQMETFGVVTTTHRTLGEAVRLAVGARAWLPATRNGEPVPQLVQLPFEFVPDSSATTLERSK